MSDLIDREELKKKKVYSNERREYVVPVAEIDWIKPAVVAENATGDNISKSEIMTALHERFPYGFEADAWWNSTVVLAAINQAKPAEQRTGRWIISSDGYYPYCSECKTEPKSGELTPYCPYCGVRMNADKESEHE